MQGKHARLIKGLLLPVLSAIYPVIFLYCNNASIVKISSLGTPLLLMIVMAVILFGGFFLVQKNALRAGISAFVFLIFFLSYGLMYTRLVKNEHFQIDHFTLLPVVIVCAFYTVFFLLKLRQAFLRRMRDILILLITGLILINVVPTLPVEVKKAQAQVEKKQVVQASTQAKSTYPDIYYIIFDEYAGFDALSGYWHYDGYKSFQAFLEQNGFFVAEHIYGQTHDTLVEMASRLNLKQYPIPKFSEDLYEAISNNKVMQILKSYGYTTVVFDGAKLGYATKTKITADYNFILNATDTKKGVTDEFSSLFYNQTMLRIFSNYYEIKDPVTESWRSMTLYSLEKVTDLGEVSSPKFVYLHLMLPHWPFLFDENGGPVDIKHKFDWNYYLGQHKYATKRAQALISTILSQSDPNRPPVIIFQSDHGARNLESKTGDGVQLVNYPEGYKTNIVNALHLPGYDYSQLPDDLPPLETFAIVLNFYLNANVAVEK